MHANSRNILDTAVAGDIVAVVGLKDTLTGDTICDVKNPGQQTGCPCRTQSDFRKFFQEHDGDSR